MAKNFSITIDGEPYETEEKKMSAAEILDLAGLSAEEYYLTQIQGNAQKSYEGDSDNSINLHEGAKFISVYIGPTPVADATPQKTGAALFAEGLQNLGYEAKLLEDNHVQFEYVVEVGKFSGLEIVMGFVVPPDFPLTPPHGPHINQQIHPIGKSGEHPTGGIHNSTKHSKHFGSSWQHWSRPHPNWVSSNKTVAEYMSFIRKLWASQ